MLSSLLYPKLGEVYYISRLKNCVKTSERDLFLYVKTIPKYTIYKGDYKRKLLYSYLLGYA